MNDYNNINNQKKIISNQTIAQQEINQGNLDRAFRLFRKFIKAESDLEIIQALMHEVSIMTHALGASYIPFDERRDPHTALLQDIEIEAHNLDAWMTYLAASSIRSQCRICRKDEPISQICPLLSNPFSRELKIFCLRLTYEKQKLGVLNLYLPNRIHIEKGTKDFLQKLASSASLAIKTLDLIKDKSKASDLNSDEKLPVPEEIAKNAILQERSRLAREIHDGLAQVLGYIKLQLSQMDIYLKTGELKDLSEAINLSSRAVSEAYIDAREAIDDLHPDPITPNFTTWLQALAADFETNFKIPTSLDNFPKSLEFPAKIQLHLSRIIQEGLSNIRKHAFPKEVQISFKKSPEGTTIEIKDDGRGFDTDMILSSSQHGLRSLQERAEIINASLTIESQPGEGTLIRIQLPDSKKVPDESKEN